MTVNDSIREIMHSWPCCDLATVWIAGLAERERQFFASFMPEVITAIVLAHHVAIKEEWNWYSTGNGGQRCDADDHLRNVCLVLKDELTRQGYDTRLVKYPGESGLQFRFVAEAAGLGEIGMNAFLFHPVWGPWIHLRVIGTTAGLEVRSELSGNQLCDRCGLCIPECPAGAILENFFDGLKCRSYRKARGEFEPQGPDGLLPYCERCIWICPIGNKPN